MNTSNDSGFTELLSVVDDDGTIPREFEEHLWGELRQTLRRLPTGEEGAHGDEAPGAAAGLQELGSSDSEAAEIISIDWRPGATSRRAAPRLVLAAAAVLIVVTVVLSIDRHRHENVNTTAAVGESERANLTETPLPPPVLTSPGAACTRYFDTLEGVVEQVSELLSTTPPGWQDTIGGPLETLSAAVGVLARDFAASSEVDTPVQLAFEFSADALGQLELEVSVGNSTAATNTLDTALGAMRGVAASLPQGPCGGFLDG